MNIKKQAKRILLNLLSKRMYRLITNGATLVPAYYKSHIEEAERLRDCILESSPEKSILLARKYGHILDKGLQNPHVEAGHSRECYENARNLISELKNTRYANDPTTAWVEEKLNEYEYLQAHGTLPELERSPSYHPNVRFEDLAMLIKGRRTNRRFKQQPVDPNMAAELIDLMNWAPSSCNKQPIKVFYTLNSNDVHECMLCCAGATGFSDYVPSFFAMTADVRGYEWPSEMMLPYIDVALGTQNFFLAATSLGLSGSILSWAQKTGQQEAKLRELLNIPSPYQIIMCGVLGYSEFDSPIPTRKLL